MAFPSPRLAPVIKAVLPSRLLVLIQEAYIISVEQGLALRRRMNDAGLAVSTVWQLLLLNCV